MCLWTLCAVQVQDLEQIKAELYEAIEKHSGAGQRFADYIRCDKAMSACRISTVKIEMCVYMYFIVWCPVLLLYSAGKLRLV